MEPQDWLVYEGSLRLWVRWTVQVRGQRPGGCLESPRKGMSMKEDGGGGEPVAWCERYRE